MRRARTSLINDNEASQRPLSVGEANALRYAAGYVPFKKLSHRPESVQCQDRLGVDKVILTLSIPGSGLNW